MKDKITANEATCILNYIECDYDDPEPNPKPEQIVRARIIDKLDNIARNTK